MDMALEVIMLPVTDIDRAKAFYEDKVGFHVDIDTEVMPGARVVQLTPPVPAVRSRSPRACPSRPGPRNRARTTACSWSSRTPRPRTTN